MAVAQLSTTSSLEEVPCLICGESEADELLLGQDEFYGIPGQFRVMCCPRCDLGYISPRPHFEEILQYYPSDYYSFAPSDGLPSVASQANHWQKTYLAHRGYPTHIRLKAWTSVELWMYRVFRGEKLGVAFRPIPRWQAGGRLLDVGCGAGFYLSELKKLGWDVYGVEISPQACAAAESSYGVPTFCGSLETAPFPPASFDVITLWEALEHLPNPQETLERAYQLLRPNGYILGSVPNRHSVYTDLFGPAYYAWELPRHLYHFSRKSFVLLAQKVGFRSVRIRTFTVGASILILSLGIRKNRRLGQRGLPTNFWDGKTLWLRLLSWMLKPGHALVDRMGLGIHIEFEAKK